MRTAEDTIPRQPIEYHRQSIGTEVEFSQSGRGKAKHCVGTITDVRHGIGSMYNMKSGERWHIIEIKIKPNDGRRAFWARFADRLTTTDQHKGRL